MTARSSDPRRRPVRSIVGDERGTTLAFVALALIVLLASVGLAVDLGRGYITKLRVARAVDAGALAGARALREGETLEQGKVLARAEALAVARVNVSDPDAAFTPDCCEENAQGELTISVDGSQEIDTTFMRVVGYSKMPVSATAEAAVPPLDVMLVLDLSSSLTGAPFVALQEGAVSFLQHFSDEIDRMGLVGFSSAAAIAVELGHNFKTPMEIQIEDVFLAGGNTHMQEGLRLAKERITGPNAREDAAKVVVFFTDGLPTSARGTYGDDTWGFQDRTLVVHQVEPDDGKPTIIAGYYNDTDGIVPPWGVQPPFVGAPCPKAVDTCFGLTALDVQDDAGAFALNEAREIRLSWDASVLVYVIALGNVQIPYLCEMANAKGPTGGPEDCVGDVTEGQPQGKVFHAPTLDELEQLFNEVARDLLVRLAK